MFGKKRKDEHDGDEPEECGGGLSWTDLSIQVGTITTTSSLSPTTATATAPSPNYLLRPCTGTIPPGCLCGILGPSGAGKTMFLSAIAGGMPRSTTTTTTIDDNGDGSGGGGGRNGSSFGGRIQLQQYGSEQLRLDERQQQICNLDPSNNKVAWLSQYDHFFSMLTVKECLDLAAFLEEDGYIDNDSNKTKECYSSRRSKLRREDLVDNTLKQLGLWQIRHRRVGPADPTDNGGGGNDDQLFSYGLWKSSSSASPSSPLSLSSAQSYGRLSGGERRRLSLGLELVAQPELFVGDEPTTGVDSSMSDNVVRLIKRHIVRRHIPGVLSLHQPRSSIWQQLDYVMLMATGGYVLYFGPRGEALDYFSRLGYECPKYTNPAEFLLDLVSVKPLDAEGDELGNGNDLNDNNKTSADSAIAEDFLSVEERISYLAKAFKEYQNSTLRKQQGKYQSQTKAGNKISQNINTRNEKHADLTSPSVNNNKKKTSQVPMKYIAERFYRLLLRSWRQNIRDNRLNAVRLVVSVGNAYLFGNVFKVPFPVTKRGLDYYNGETVPDRTGLLCMGVVNMVMMTVMKTIDLISNEKPVVLREQRRNQYSCLEYLLCKAWAELPLDILFALLFAAVIKTQNGLRISFSDLAIIFALMTTCGASLGLSIGAWSSNKEVAMAVGVPLMIILLSVGMLTQGDVETMGDESLLVVALQSISPIYYANKAICLQEYHGMLFEDPLTISLFGFIINRMRRKEMKMKEIVSAAPTGDDIVEELGIGDKTFEDTIRRLVGLSILFLFIFGSDSWCKRPKVEGDNLVPPFRER
mmetsp:Transcript_24845/g.58981  ORF Transcript_24845/g.58981 Transcript_24845/m.58981 type:complete len:807 (-) Transcript_24845:42-2462(-)